RLPDGRVRVAGLELRPQPAAAETAPRPVPPDDDTTDDALPPLPRIEVRGAGVSVDRFASYDRVARADVPPFVVEDRQLSLAKTVLRETQSWAFVLGHDGRASAFLALVGSGRVKDVLERVQIQLQC